VCGCVCGGCKIWVVVRQSRQQDIFARKFTGGKEEKKGKKKGGLFTSRRSITGLREWTTRA